VKKSSKRGKAWLRGEDFGTPGNIVRDELLRRVEHFEVEVKRFGYPTRQYDAGVPGS
jgi:hypothetical protein